MLPLPRKFRTSKARARYRRFLLRRSGIIVVCVAFCLVAFFGLLHLSLLRIDSVAVQETNDIPKDAIAESITNILAGSYFGIVPKSLFFAYPKSTIMQTIKDTYPTIASVTLSVSMFDQLVASVTERVPIALWCGDVAPEGRGKDLIVGTCYHIDADGFIFERADDRLVETSDDTSFVHYYGAIVHGTPVGQYFLDKETFIKLTTLASVLKSIGQTPIALLVIDEKDAEIYTLRGEKILVTYTDSPYDIRDNLTSVLASDALKDTDVKRLDYIDLRFGNKVYYKFRDIQSTSTVSLVAEPDI